MRRFRTMAVCRELRLVGFILQYQAARMGALHRLPQLLRRPGELVTISGWLMLELIPQTFMSYRAYRLLNRAIWIPIAVTVSLDHLLPRFEYSADPLDSLPHQCRGYSLGLDHLLGSQLAHRRCRLILTQHLGSQLTSIVSCEDSRAALVDFRHVRRSDHHCKLASKCPPSQIMKLTSRYPSSTA